LESSQNDILDNQALINEAHGTRFESLKNENLELKEKLVLLQDRIQNGQVELLNRTNEVTKVRDFSNNIIRMKN